MLESILEFRLLVLSLLSVTLLSGIGLGLLLSNLTLTKVNSRTTIRRKAPNPENDNIEFFARIVMTILGLSSLVLQLIIVIRHLH